MVSPDLSVAACSHSEGIRLVPLRGGAARDLVKAKASVFMTWTPDGKHLIYFVEEGPADNNLVRPRQAWIVPVSGGEPRRLNLPFGGRALSIHPDARQVAINVTDESTELWVTENLKIN